MQVQRSEKKAFGPFRIVQASHLRRADPFGELTQEQRLVRAKQDARSGDHANLVRNAFAAVDDRRYREAPVTMPGVLA